MSLFSWFSGASAVPSLSADAFADGIRNTPGAIVIDVRTGDEYATGHIPGAMLADVLRQDFKTSIDTLSRDKTYYVYCRSGMRSKRACKIMKKNGFTNIYNLTGGITQWNGALRKGKSIR